MAPLPLDAPTVIVRDERPLDVDGIREVLTHAFGRPDEAVLVDALRAAGKVQLSLVAESEGQVVGHVLFTAVTIAGDDTLLASGLAPLAVVPRMHGVGVGSALVRQGLARCRRAGHAFVVVLGDPRYYGRFGFVAAEQYQMHCEFDAPAGAFQVIELRRGALTAGPALVRYEPEFAPS
jgi:putative acetyltransferase